MVPSCLFSSHERLGCAFGRNALVSHDVLFLSLWSFDWCIFDHGFLWILDFAMRALVFQHRGFGRLVEEHSSGPQASGWTWTCAWALGKACGNACRSQLLHKKWFFALSLLCLLRVGEAAHPGPPGMEWSLGIANPSGLNSKVDQVAAMGGVKTGFCRRPSCLQLVCAILSKG